jgi:hypothetical protein
LQDNQKTIIHHPSARLLTSLAGVHCTLLMVFEFGCSNLQTGTPVPMQTALPATVLLTNCQSLSGSQPVDPVVTPHTLLPQHARHPCV